MVGQENRVNKDESPPQNFQKLGNKKRKNSRKSPSQGKDAKGSQFPNPNKDPHQRSVGRVSSSGAYSQSGDWPEDTMGASKSQKSMTSLKDLPIPTNDKKPV